MFPNGDGTAIASFTDGTAQTFTNTRAFVTTTPPAQNSYDLWTSLTNTKLLVWLQDEATDEILNSKVIAPQFPEAITKISDVSGVVVYPNPTNGAVNVAIESSTINAVTVNIVDAMGKLVYVKANSVLAAGTNNLSIDLSNLSVGTYVVRVIAKDGTFEKTISKK
jgi:fibronectin type 3 domain-containing protein